MSFVKKFSSITVSELKKTLTQLGVYFEPTATKDTLYALYTSVLESPEEIGEREKKQFEEKKEKEKKKKEQIQERYLIYMTFITNYYHIPSAEYDDIKAKRKYKTSFPGTYLNEEADIDNHAFFFYTEKDFENAIKKLTIGFYKLHYTDKHQTAQIINIFKGKETTEGKEGSEKKGEIIEGYRVDDMTKGAEKNYKLDPKEALAFDTLDFTDLGQDEYDTSLSYNSVHKNLAAVKFFTVYINKIFSVPPEEEISGGEEEDE